MEAANSRGIGSGACSVCSHQVQSAHAPVGFDEHESDWFNADGELMISRLMDDEWAERGLPIAPAVDTGGSRTSARGRVIARARAGKAAAVDAAAAKAARADALRAHTHTFTHFACEGGTCRCLALHAHAHSLSIHSVWGGAGLQVLNVASRVTRARKVIRIWRRFRKAPRTLCNVFISYIAYIVYMLHIYCILHIVHI